MLRSRAWIPVAALAALLAAAVGWRSASDTGDVASGLAELGPAATPSLSDSLLAHLGDEPMAIDPDAATLVGFDPLLDGDTVHADAVDVPVPLSRPAEQAMPGALPIAAGAQPIDVQTAHAEQQLDELIARELANLPEQQQTVWREVLQGLPAKEAEEILQIWKLTGRSDAARMPPTWSPAGMAPAPVVDAPTGRIPSAMAEVIRRNLEQIDTPGYLRRDAAATTHDVALLDLTPGEIRRTGNPLHVALDGPGFFCLRREGQTAFTRCGRFELGADGELVQLRADGEWSLSPPLQIPSDAVQLQISESGEVRVRRAGSASTSETCGRLVLATFLNPQHLDTLDAELLTPTAKSGTPFSPAPPELSSTRLLQHALEMSNATLETEAAILDRWERRSALLQRLTSGSDHARY